MPPALQIKLLRILQEKTFRRVGGEKDIEVDCRVIAATHRNLQQMVDEGKFREDLYYRLNVINLHVPPLRDRREDVSSLANYFVRSAAAKMNKSIRNIEPEALEKLKNYSWPGNIRELQNVVERTVALSSGDTIDVSDLPTEIINYEDGALPFQDIKQFNQAKSEFERKFLIAALEEHNYNVSNAAKASAIPRQNFYLKMKKYGIKLPGARNNSNENP
jgi:DNA-binding NtrC family response regulator